MRVVSTAYPDARLFLSTRYREAPSLEDAGLCCSSLDRTRFLADAAADN